MSILVFLKCEQTRGPNVFLTIGLFIQTKPYLEPNIQNRLNADFLGLFLLWVLTNPLHPNRRCPQPLQDPQPTARSTQEAELLPGVLSKDPAHLTTRTVWHLSHSRRLINS